MGYIADCAARRGKITDAIESQKRTFGHKQPPLLAADLTDETIIEGKTIREWDEVLAGFDERMRYPPAGKLIVLDTTSTFPGWSLWAVQQWRSHGRPSPHSKLVAAINKATEDANKHNALCLLEEERAAKAVAAKNTKKAQQHKRYAQTQRETAQKFWDEVARLREELKAPPL